MSGRKIPCGQELGCGRYELNGGKCNGIINYNRDNDEYLSYHAGYNTCAVAEKLNLDREKIESLEKIAKRLVK